MPQAVRVIDRLVDQSDWPLTTQDDLLIGGASGVPARLAKGSDSQVLTVDPVTHHLVWATPSGGSGSVATDAIFDAKGDLPAGTGADTAAKLPVGANDTILMADSAQTTGLKWVAPATASTQAFGDAAAEGTADTYTRGDHKHAMMADPVTAHAAAGDPHTGYRLESADHSHATTGLQAGQLAQANTHQSPDTDSATSSLHHTIGGTSTTAAAGDHAHAATYAPISSPFATFGADATLSGEVDLQALTGVNEFKGWPSVVETGDLDALALWWRKIATPTGGVTVAAISGESASNQPGNGLTASTIRHHRALKCVAAASGDGLKQTWTFADEPRLKVGRVFSALVDLWIAQSSATRTITLKLINSDATVVSTTKQVVAGWNRVALENLTLAGTSVDLQVTADGAVTFYVVPLGAEVDAPKARPLARRPTRYMEKAASILSANDPGGASFTDSDQTSNTSPLTFKVHLVVAYGNRTQAGNAVYLRRNGDTTAASVALEATRNEVTTASTYGPAARGVLTDDGQIFEWQTSGIAAQTEDLNISLFAYEEYA